MRIGDGRLLQIFVDAAAAALVRPFQFDRHARAVDIFVAIVNVDPFDAVLRDVSCAFVARRNVDPFAAGR